MSSRYSRAFTLVEMLVVIGIIAVLAALLLPAVNKAINTARNTAIGVEINQLASAIEAYKQDKGDYPPNFRDQNVVARHIRKCYPKIDPTYYTSFMNKAFPATGSTVGIDEGECLVFWLSMTDSDPRYPFLSYPVTDSSGKLYSATRTPNPKKYYDFDQTKLFSSTADAVNCYKAKYSKDTYYIYIDSRSYDNPAVDTTDVARFKATDGTDTYAYGDDQSTNIVRPYWSSTSTGTTTGLRRAQLKPANQTTFQIICAGQDGDFGTIVPAGDTDVKVAAGDLAGTNFNEADKDNITNFSNGRTLGDAIK